MIGRLVVVVPLPVARVQVCVRITLQFEPAVQELLRVPTAVGVNEGTCFRDLPHLLAGRRRRSEDACRHAAAADGWKGDTCDEEHDRWRQDVVTRRQAFLSIQADPEGNDPRILRFRLPGGEAWPQPAAVTPKDARASSSLS